MELKNPYLSVCMISYNHEKFIGKAIESVLMQKTTFPVELIISEDCSSDSTRNICIEYQRGNPDKIILLDSTKNLGMSRNFLRTLLACRGKYIALCEGDDFWTDPEKIQKQVTFLDNNPDFFGVFHQTTNVDEYGKVINQKYFLNSKSRYNQEECLKQLRSSYASCSLVFRSEVLQGKLPIWFSKRSCDQFLDLLITKYGNLYFIPDNMGAYRIHRNGVWQGSTDLWKLQDKWLRNRLLYKDNNMKKKYKDYLTQELRKNTFNILYHPDISFKLKLKYIRHAVSFLDLKDRDDFFLSLKKISAIAVDTMYHRS